MTTTNFIGEQISILRKSNNLSQSQLSERLGITAQAVGKWERGESVPDVIMLDRIAELFGVDLNYFSMRTPEEYSIHTAMPVLQQFSSAEKSKKPEETNYPVWNMSSGNWSDADFSGLKNLGQKFNSSNIKNCLFVGSELTGLTLSGNNSSMNDFTDSDMSASLLKGSNLFRNKFIRCNFKKAGFNGSNMTECDFSGADFTESYIKGSNFNKDDFTDAIFDRTTIAHSSFKNITFRGDITDCAFDNNGYHNVTFENCVITNTFFKGNVKKVKFIHCKADNITIAFLKSAKANIDEIVQI